MKRWLMRSSLHVQRTSNDLTQVALDQRARLVVPLAEHLAQAGNSKRVQGVRESKPGLPFLGVQGNRYVRLKCSRIAAFHQNRNSRLTDNSRDNRRARCLQSVREFRALQDCLITWDRLRKADRRASETSAHKNELGAEQPQ